MSFLPTVYITNYIRLNASFTRMIITASWSGDLIFEVSANADAVSPTWHTISLSNNLPSTFYLTPNTGAVKLIITGLPGDILEDLLVEFE
ncbi:MAG TPA: hypothetical protein V6C58_25530 [Allocoleopsis sp.]